MEKYEKRIKYLDYLEYGTKIRNGGFLRTEKTGDYCRVHISVKGLYPTDTLATDVMLYCGVEKRKVEVMMLHYGKGDYTATWNTDNLAGSGMSYGEWTGIEISVSEHRKLMNVWQMPLEQPEYVSEDYVQEECLPVQLQSEYESEIAESTTEKTEVAETVIAEQPECYTSPKEEREVRGKNRQAFSDLYEDKWTQLEQYYKRIRPFGDKRSYLSITPRDFIVLGGKYQKFVSNSFLLHGYYNYGHVVLKRQEEDEGYRYYLGVPGIYHEREKQVAKMFGFNGFEGAVSPSNEGGFGYYMTDVEI